MLDSNTECMMAEAICTLYMRDIWKITEDDYTLINNIKIGNCNGGGELLDLIVEIYPVDEP